MVSVSSAKSSANANRMQPSRDVIPASNGRMWGVGGVTIYISKRRLFEKNLDVS